VVNMRGRRWCCGGEVVGVTLVEVWAAVHDCAIISTHSADGTTPNPR